MSENVKPKTFSKEWFSDPKNVVVTIIGAALMCGLFYLFATHVLPWLVTVTWNLVNLIIGLVIFGILLMIFTNKKFWRAIKYLSELIGRYTLGLVIELNPFNILEMKIEQAIKDRKALKIAGDKVSGKKIELESKIESKKKDLGTAVRNSDSLRSQARKLLNDGKQSEATLVAADYEVQAAKVTQLRDYIESLTPIAQDLKFLENHYKKVYKLCGTRIEISENELKLGRDKYEAVMSGAGVARAAWKAIVGNDDLNADAEAALATIQRKVSNSLAEMKNTMDLTNNIIRSIERDNFTSAKEGMEIIRKMEETQNFEYNTISSSDWNEDGQFNKTSSYADLLIDEMKK